MSCTILLYLFCLTSVSDDVISVVGVLSIWQCYGYNETCGMDLPARPHILNGSSTLTVEDLPTEDKLPVSMDNLLSKILEEQFSSYGLLILEAGNTSLIEWQLESSNSTLKIESSSETSPPLVQESFVRNLTIYHFNASLYEGRPDQVTVVAPHSSLTFHLKQNCVISNCHHTALIFAPLRWTTAISNAFPLQFNKVRMSDCEICLSLPLPAELIRVCPQIQQARCIDNISTISMEDTISSVSPPLWDMDVSNQTFEVAINSSANLSIEEANSCLLYSDDGHQYTMKPQNVSKSAIKVSVVDQVKPGRYSLTCSCKITNQTNEIELTYRRGLHAVNFTSLVETEPDLHPKQCHPSTIQATFKTDLSTSGVSVDQNSAYCLIDNAAYHGVISGKTMRCELGNFTRDTEMDIYFIRSRTLHNITLQKQKPVRLQSSCSSTNLTVSLSNDLLGLLIACGDACPTGLIPCKNVIAEYFALGKGAVCIGDGDHVIVRFGKAATLGISDPVTVLNTRLPLYVSKTIPHPNFTLSYSSEVMSCMTEVLVEVKRVTGDGGRPLHYTWKAVNASVELSRVFEGATNRTVSLPTKLLKHEVELSVTGCNFVNLCTTSDAIRLRPVTAEATLSVSLGGVSRSAVPSTAIRIRAVPELSRCNETHTIVPNDAQYNWSINGQFVTNDDSYRIPAFAYGVGDSVDVVVEVNYRDVPSTQHLRATVSETITFVAEELVAMVDAVSRTVAFDAAVVIDASGSKNPNERNGFVTHVWSCLNITSRKKCELPPLVELKSSILRIPARILNLGMSFNFSDNVRAENMSETVWSMVTIGPPKLPQISFIPSSSNKVSVGDYVRIQAFVTVQNSWLNTSWEIVRTSDTGYINISTFLENPISSFTQAQLSASNRVAVSLTIPPVDINLYPNWTGLQPGVQYAIRLIANSSDGCSFADVQIVVNAPPTVGIVEFMPTEGAIALTTQIEFRMGDGWYDDDMPLQYRFGIVILMKDNSKQSYWFTRTGSVSHRMYLPAASRQNPGCGKFIGFRALLEVCDLFSSCSVAESEMFEVSQSTNITVAIVDLVAAINSDMSNGNIFDSLINMHAMDIQKCEKDFDTVTADKITTKLLLTLDEDSDSNDYKEVLSSASTIMNAVSPSVLESLIFVLEHYRSCLGLTTTQPSMRSKRSITAKSLTNEQEADDMLVMYDLLLDKNQRIVDVYMLNIHDFLSAFCIQLDTSSSRIMSAQGNGYTMIQAQSLVPGSQSFSNSSFSIAGVHGGAITFSAEFRAHFSSWSCGPSRALCQNICLASSQIKMSAVFKNDQLMDFLFGNTFDSITANKSASQVYKIELLDPLSGEPVPLVDTAQYTVYIPLVNYDPANYYACLLFSHNVWETKCITSNFAINVDGEYRIRCSCSAAGLLSVFTTAPPVPVQYPDHNEVRITFDLNTRTPASVSEQATFLARLATASNVDSRRFVNVSSSLLSTTISQISLTLRPPFRISQMANSYTVQAIQRAVDKAGGFYAYDNVTVLRTTPVVVKRDLIGDGNARKAMITIDRSFQNVIGNDSSSVATKWCESISSMLRVSVYRFKNPRVVIGILFNLTITLPFEDELTPLSAEEISLMLVESSKYHEFDLQSIQGETLPVQPITNNDIVELIVDRQLNTLVLVLIIVISSLLVVASLYLGGAVIVKVRTDRLVAEERNKLIQLQPVTPPAAPPQYTTTVSPAVALADRYPEQRLRHVSVARHK
ncbi:hypothetical protein Q1695_001619 [Nippostrongylus brasiliensis]|nr:hypothetical protein Q1695_001619 [Nippostrongylus brasiliensis]